MTPSSLPAYAEVAFPLSIDKTLHYAVPPHLREVAAPGKRAIVPLGTRVVSGYLVRLPERVEIQNLKEIHDILDPEPLLDQRLLELTRRVAEYYCASWGEVIKAALPPGIDASTRKLVRLTHQGRQAQTQAGPRSLKTGGGIPPPPSRRRRHPRQPPHSTTREEHSRHPATTPRQGAPVGRNPPRAPSSPDP